MLKYNNLKINMDKIYHLDIYYGVFLKFEKKIIIFYYFLTLMFILLLIIYLSLKIWLCFGFLW